MLPSAILSRVNVERDGTLLTTVQILTNQMVSNGAGGQTEDWVVTDTQKGRLRKVTHRPGDQRSMGSDVQVVMHWQCLVDPGVSIQVTNRLRINGRDFNIHSHDSGRTGALSLIVDCDPIDEI